MWDRMWDGYRPKQRAGLALGRNSVRPLNYGDHMDTSIDIHHTAVAWYLAKVVNGSTPSQVVGGSLDGLVYYEVDIDGTAYWLTDVGLFTPPTEEP